MRRYEVVFVLAPTLAEEEVEQQIETFSGVAVEMGAEIVDVDKWGKRRLAFPVKKHSEGYYTILSLHETEAAAVSELERRFKVNDAVIRFLTVRVDEDLKRAEQFERRREARQKRRGARAQATASTTTEESAEA
ncbi:MAG: 30S ribosomal protein S6 [Acidobacteriota bacterium]|nr:MAG: 30S ribosomal protein S6 [Acidobacteriota bacterium]